MITFITEQSINTKERVLRRAGPCRKNMVLLVVWRINNFSGHGPSHVHFELLRKQLCWLHDLRTSHDFTGGCNKKWWSLLSDARWLEFYKLHYMRYILPKRIHNRCRWWYSILGQMLYNSRQSQQQPGGRH